MSPVEENALKSTDPAVRIEVRLALLEQGHKNIERELGGIKKIMTAIFIAVLLMVIGSFWQFVADGGLSADAREVAANAIEGSL